MLRRKAIEMITVARILVAIHFISKSDKYDCSLDFFHKSLLFLPMGEK